MSRLPKPIKRTGSANFYLRITVPAELRERYGGKQEIWRTLGTPSPAEAKRLAPSVLKAIYEEFDAKRHAREPTEADLQAIAWERYQYIVQQDELLRHRTPTDDEVARAERAAVDKHGNEDEAELRRIARIANRKTAYEAARARRKKAIKSSDPNLYIPAVRPLVDAELAKRGLHAVPGSKEYRMIATAIQRGELEALKRADERDNGEWGGATTDSLVRAPTSGSASTAPAGQRIMDHFSNYQQQQGARYRPDTLKQNEQIVRLFAEAVGETKPVDKLTKRDVAQWRDQLLKFPTKAQQVREFRGMRFPQIVKANEKLGRPTLEPKTVNKYLSGLSPFARWLSSNGYASSLILTEEMYLTIDRSKRGRDPFTDDQLKRLFGSPLFQRCQGDKKEHLEGDVAIRDWRYWVPLIALFSGMRLGEIAQLLVSDVRQIHGHWIMHVTDEGDDEKTVKTVTSNRIVPVHSRLIALGLIDYREARTKAGDKRLFPEIRPDARGFFSGRPSKFLNGYMRALGLKTGSTAFHSLRHNFADRLRAAGYLDHQFGFILGHGDRFGMTTGRYGSVEQGTLAARVELIEAVQYAGIGPSAV